MTPSAGLRVVTDAVIIPSVIDLVVTATLFVAVLFTVFTHVAEEAYVLFPTAAMAMGNTDEVRKDVLEDGVIVNLLLIRGRHGVGIDVFRVGGGLVRHRVGRAHRILHPPLFQFF